MITGIFSNSGFLRICLNSTNPDLWGIITSSTMQSGCTSLTFSRPSLPSYAPIASYPFSLRANEKNLTVFSSSSMTRTFLGIWILRIRLVFGPVNWQ